MGAGAVVDNAGSPAQSPLPRRQPRNQRSQGNDRAGAAGRCQPFRDRSAAAHATRRVDGRRSRSRRRYRSEHRRCPIHPDRHLRCSRGLPAGRERCGERGPGPVVPAGAANPGFHRRRRGSRHSSRITAAGRADSRACRSSVRARRVGKLHRGRIRSDCPLRLRPDHTWTTMHILMRPMPCCSDQRHAHSSLSNNSVGRAE